MHRSWLDTISRSATHLLGIINDIITLKAARTGVNLKQELVGIEYEMGGVTSFAHAVFGCTN